MLISVIGKNKDYEMLAFKALVLANARRLIKNMNNRTLCSELFGCGAGTSNGLCEKLGLDPDSNKTNYGAMMLFLEGV